MKAAWTVACLDLYEARRKRLVLVIGLLALFIVSVTTVVGLGFGVDAGVSVAEMALGNLQQLVTLLAVIVGAGALAEQSNLYGLVIRPVSRPAVVAGRFLANVLLLAALIGVCAGMAALTKGLAGGGLSGAAGMLRTGAVLLLNGSLAVALAMALSLWLPWIPAAIVTWLGLSVSATVGQFGVIGPIMGLPEAVSAGARVVGYFLPHISIALDVTMLPAGAALPPGLGVQATWTGLWILGLIGLTILRFRRHEL